MSKRFYTVAIWDGKEAPLQDQDTGEVALWIKDEDKRRFKKAVAEEMLARLREKHPNAVFELCEQKYIFIPPTSIT